MNHLPYDETGFSEAKPLVTPKTSKGNLIRLSDFYKDYCGTPEYVEVSDEVLTFLIESKREEKKIQMRDYRHLASFSFKEKEMAEISGVYEPSTEEILMKAYISSALHGIDMSVPAVVTLLNKLEHGLVDYAAEMRSDEILDIDDE